MTCEDAIAILAEFLDHALPAAVGEALEAHLSDCAPCRAYLRTYEKTRWLVGRMGRPEMPAELKTRLRAFLVDQLTRRPA
ncbi:MAG: hypothetical protein DMD83_10465 [Candidatus Rokuibacteriota bacterium]|nr:MAG: hypothetical protein DMD83_10465 [Candidatus Rokubacteria bacterium]